VIDIGTGLWQSSQSLCRCVSTCRTHHHHWQQQRRPPTSSIATAFRDWLFLKCTNRLPSSMKRLFCAGRAKKLEWAALQVYAKTNIKRNNLFLASLATALVTARPGYGRTSVLPRRDHCPCGLWILSECFQKRQKGAIFHRHYRPPPVLAAQLHHFHVVRCQGAAALAEQEEPRQITRGTALGESFAVLGRGGHCHSNGDDEDGTTSKDQQPARPSSDSATPAATRGGEEASSDRSALTAVHFPSRSQSSYLAAS
jgi:hypothetical protein